MSIVKDFLKKTTEKINKPTLSRSQTHKALSKKYFKLIWSHFITFFKLPKIIVVVALLLITPLVLKSLIYIPQEIR